MSPEDLKARVDATLDALLPVHSDIAQPLMDAMRHATLSGGKRLRPMLTCATSLAVGGEVETALEPGCAVEFIHAYSLVHDDLPSMDDDALRHGVAACHIAYGEATAILAGDALQTLAFETLARNTALDSEIRLEMVTILAHASGAAGMVGGQQFDLDSENQQLALAPLESLHAAKTGAMFSAAIDIGALAGGATAEQRDGLRQVSAALGLAFQIVDDVLDATASSDTLGKPAGSDAQQNKSTFVTLMGSNAAQARAEAVLTEVEEGLERLGFSDTLLAEICKLAVRRAF